ncbi:kinase-like protein [Sanghuangporus baumii]|uniref:Kinase-like protein n=1 Tax=Sanghuangporus baumii TaxID=108892 RepID=A0A9Q5I2L2_SANBA|nr:kinase-like protein [Sanghuangporus baumii]
MKSASGLDEAEYRCKRLLWKIVDRQSRGLLGPSIIEENDNISLPVHFDSELRDTQSMLVEDSLAQVEKRIKQLRNHPSHDIIKRLDLCTIFGENDSRSLAGAKNYFKVNDHLEKVSQLSLPIRQEIDGLESYLDEIVERRSQYRYTYMCAYYANFLREDDNINSITRPPHGNAKAECRAIYPHYSLQTIYGQSQDLYVLSKRIVSNLEYLHKPRSELEPDVYIPENMVQLLLDVANKFEKSLQYCCKYPHPIIGASGLVQNAALSIQHVLKYCSGNPVDDQYAEDERDFQRWVSYWEESLKFLMDYGDPNFIKCSNTRRFGGSSGSKFFHDRAKIFCHNEDPEDPKNFCERENVTFANIGSRIAGAYPGKLLFDGLPVNRDCTTWRGSCGEVYEVTLPACRGFVVPVDTFGKKKIRTFFCEKVAVKKILLSPSLSEVRACARILRELETRVVLRHESILPLIGLWSNFDDSDLNYPLLVSPWMNGGDLHHFIKGHSKTSILSRLIFLRDVASALAYMHEYHNVEFVHGDLKGENVLVHEGRAYLHDFGMTRISVEDEGLRTLEPSGSWRWQAPELLDLFRDKLPCEIHPTPQSDMYAYGSLFLEVMTGVYPWDIPGAFNYRIQNRSKIQKRPDIIRDDRHWSLMKHCWMEEPTLRITAQRALVVLKQLVTEEEQKDGQSVDSVDFKDKYLY